MKYVLLPFVLAIIMSSCSTSRPNLLGKMPKTEREAYLIKLGKEVTKAFGPGYYREYKQPIISKPKKFKDNDMRPEIQANIGRKYYVVTFLYDPSKETLDWNHASQVEIWKDTGEPMGATFGNGYGKDFIFDSYEEQLRSPDKTIVPYQQAPPLPDVLW